MPGEHHGGARDDHEMRWCCDHPHEMARSGPCEGDLALGAALPLRTIHPPDVAGGGGVAGGQAVGAGDAGPDGAQYYVSTQPVRPSAGVRQLLGAVALPCWLPHRRLADALGHPHTAIVAAEAACGGRGYRWASEFENVHDLWPFQEPGFVAHGVRFSGSEQFFQLHKHQDAGLWPGRTTPVSSCKLGLRRPFPRTVFY